MIDQRIKYDLQTIGRKRQKTPAIRHIERNAERHRMAQVRRAEKDTKRRSKIKKAKAIAPLRQAEKILYKVTNYQTVPYVKGMKAEFYATAEWRKLRWKVISTSSGKCNVCGRSNKAHGVVMHVDHKLPRSKYPELELDEDNMQLLCEDCNLGKGAKLQTF